MTQEWSRKKWTVSEPPTTHSSTEPAKPSHDFLGLIVGAIGCLPKRTPAAYPPTSLQTAVTRKTNIRATPSSAESRSMAKPTRKVG